MKIQDFIFWILVLLGIIVLIWYVIGDSPTLEQALLIFILALVIKNSISIKGLSSEFKNLDKKFSALVQDFKEHIRHK